MPEQFDPYHLWLGISPKDQPPNHYRLLGIDRFEVNSNVISNAADQRMAHVRSFQTGKNSELSQVILNEISAARICLLNPQRKQAYDAQLRKSMAAATPPTVQPAAAAVQEAPADAFGFLDQAAQNPTFRKRQIKKKPNQFHLALAVVVFGGVALIGIVAVSLSRGNGDLESPREVALQDEDDAMPPPRTTPKPKTEPKTVVSTPKPRSKIEEQPEPKIKAKLELKPEPEQDKAAPQFTGENKTTPAPEETPKESPLLPKKLPVPNAAAQQKSLAVIRDVFKGEDIAVVAKKLLARARETKDVADRYVMLREAVKTASETWQGDLAFEIIDAIAGEFDVSAPAMKAEVLEQAAKRPRITPGQKTAIANAAMKTIDEATAEDDFETAKRLGRLAGQMSALSKDRDFSRDILAKNREVAIAAKAFDEAREAMAVLKKEPNDAEANLTVGRYYCFAKDDWSEGLPLLAKGGDAGLKALAERDLAGADSPADQVKLGDAWWDGGGKSRATFWYEKAMPGLNGLEKERVGKRLTASVKTIYLADMTADEVRVLQNNNIHQQTTFKGIHKLHALYAHPPDKSSSSHIAYQLDKQFSLLRGEVGIQTDAPPPASPLTFRIVADGKLLWTSRPIQVVDVSQPFRVNVAGVKKLELFVDCPGWHWNAWAVWLDPVLTKTTSGNIGVGNGLSDAKASTRVASDRDVWLDAIAPLEHKQSFGSLKINHSLDNNPLIIGEKTYSHGLGTHANAEALYSLAGRYGKFKAECGIDAESGRNGSCVFQVWADGKKLFDSGLMRGGEAAQQIAVDIRHRKMLKLVVLDGGDNPHGDHADWANARLLLK